MTSIAFVLVFILLIMFIWAKSKDWVNEQQDALEKRQIERLMAKQKERHEKEKDKAKRKLDSLENLDKNSGEHLAQDAEQPETSPAEQAEQSTTRMSGGGDPQPNTEGKSPRKLSKTAIAGGVIGGIALVLMLVSGALEYRIGYAVDPNIDA